MQRLVNQGKRLPDKAGEPDFYDISKRFPLADALLAPVPPTGPSLEWKAPGAASPSAVYPHPPSQQSMAYTSPYMYGYPQAAPHPPFHSPAKLANDEHNPSEQPRQMYWQNPQQPPVSPYGYYSYPPMMMAQPPQGYYMAAYSPQVAAMQHQYFPPTTATPSQIAPTEPVADPAAISSKGDLGSVSKPKVSEQQASIEEKDDCGVVA